MLSTQRGAHPDKNGTLLIPTMPSVLVQYTMRASKITKRWAQLCGTPSI